MVKNDNYRENVSVSSGALSSKISMPKLWMVPGTLSCANCSDDCMRIESVISKDERRGCTRGTIVILSFNT